MTRRDFLMKWLLYAAVTLLLVLLQSLVLTHIHLLDIHPFALPLLAGIIAVWEPQRECAFYGLVFGLVCDLTMPAAMPCLYTLSFLIAGLLVNFIARKLIMPGFWCSMVGAALALVMTDVLQALSQIYRHGSADFAAAAALTGRELLLIVPLAPLLYLPLHWIYRRTRGVYT